jgi:nucleoid-associated protein YgaU
MTLRTFTWELKGAEGDIYYTVEFRERKTIRPQQIAVTTNSTGTITASRKPAAADRPAVAAKGKPATYTVKSGDSLVLVAKHLGVNPWQTLYDKNKAVIGADPGKIKPGQVLTV